MTNMEKYRDTSAAYAAYEEYRRRTAKSGAVHVGMQVWLERECDERPGLMKAVGDFLEGGTSGKAAHDRLRAAYEAEKSRPRKNFERYGSDAEALDAFRRMCVKTENCAGCRYEKAGRVSRIECIAAWIYDTAD